MEHPGNIIDTSFDFNNIQNVLITQLNRSRQQSPQSFLKEIHVLPAVDNNIDGQLEQQLRQECQEHTGHRMLLIPYCLENSHWTGIVIEFQSNNEIFRIEYIDAVDGCNSIPDALQRQLAKVYPSAVIETKDIYKHNDQRFSAALTLKNLLVAAENSVELQRTNNVISNENDASRNLTTSESSTQSKKQTNAQASSSFADEGHQYTLVDKQQELSKGLEKFRIRSIDILSQRIIRSKARLEEYEEEERIDDVERERAFLKELQRLQTLVDEIAQQSPVSPPSVDEPPQQESKANNIVPLDKKEEKRLRIDDLIDDACSMPACARKTLIELLVLFEKKLLGETTVSARGDALNFLQKLKDQVNREELLSDAVQTILHNLETYLTGKDDSLIMHNLNALLRLFRPLNVARLQRLISNTREAAKLIQNKDVVLPVCTTGAGKSTTIQFLAGATMKEITVEVAPGKFLSHITAVEPILNPDLRNVISSPSIHTQTLTIIPVNIQLKDILGTHESGTLTLCDTTGINSTIGPEIDIAYSVGINDVLKKAKSVKILALLSLRCIGHRGQGIQRLAHLLTSIMHDIEDKLDSIVYGFTRYSDSVDINALLVDIKRSVVDDDVSVASAAFISVLDDMIEKTEEGAIKIEPIKDDPRKLLGKLKRMRGIKNPEEVFRYSLSEDTRVLVSEYVQRDKLSIICAMKHKDYDLILYYLDELQILNDLLKEESFIQDAYEESVRFLIENINNYCAEMREKFNRVLASQDGLENKHILDYRTAISHLKHVQILKGHLKSALISSTSMLENVLSELNVINRNLIEEELYSPAIGIYLRNLFELKNSFDELREFYKNSCKMFQERFDELAQYARELIPEHDFQQIAEVLLNLYQSARVLQDHTDERVQGAYGDIVIYLLRYLERYCERADKLLAKSTLSHEEVETIKSYMEILRSAKENVALQECVSLHLKMAQEKEESAENYNSLGLNIKDLNGIYDEFIGKIGKSNSSLEIFQCSTDRSAM